MIAQVTKRNHGSNLKAQGLFISKIIFATVLINFKNDSYSRKC